MAQSCTDQLHITVLSSCSHAGALTQSLVILSQSPPCLPSPLALSVNLSSPCCSFHSTQMLDLFRISATGPVVEYQTHSNRGVNS